MKERQLPPYTGLIGTGDQFIWQPYGTPGCPKAFCYVEVNDILFNGEENIIRYIRINPLGDAVDEATLWSDEEHFRDSVILHRRAERINDYEPYKYTTDKPRIP
jgi:nucleoside phosphorylase